MKETLCFSCDTKIFTKCLQAHGGKPVEGQKIEQVKVKDGGKVTLTDRVISCPNYKIDPREIERSRCGVCKEIYESKGRNSKYCSDACRVAGYKMATLRKQEKRKKARDESAKLIGVN